ncbi:MAG: hypothetical protein ACMXYA_01740 [Candidatus Woesearchaeota archaeon]
MTQKDRSIQQARIGALEDIARRNKHIHEIFMRNHIFAQQSQDMSKKYFRKIGSRAFEGLNAVHEAHHDFGYEILHPEKPLEEYFGHLPHGQLICSFEIQSLYSDLETQIKPYIEELTSIRANDTRSIISRRNDAQALTGITIKETRDYLREINNRGTFWFRENPRKIKDYLKHRYMV